MRLIPWKDETAVPTEAQLRYYQYFLDELLKGKPVRIKEYTAYPHYYLESCVERFLKTRSFEGLLQDTQVLLDVYGANYEYIEFEVEMNIRLSGIYLARDRKAVKEFLYKNFANDNINGRVLHNPSHFFTFFQTSPKNMLKVEDVQLAVNIRDFFTDFGKNHLLDMTPIIDLELEKHHSTNGENLLYSIFKPYLHKMDKLLFGGTPYSRSKNVLNCKVSSTHPVVAEPLAAFFRNCENIYRESLNLPKVGQGWISETLLYEQVKAAFPSLRVIQHASPQFLAPQHLDVYIPEIQLGLEYQGDQHFKAIDIFGGEKGLAKTKERDELKRQKMSSNHHYLIEVLPNYDLTKILNQIIALAAKRGMVLKINPESLSLFQKIENELTGRRKLKEAKPNKQAQNELREKAKDIPSPLPKARAFTQRERSDLEYLKEDEKNAETLIEKVNIKLKYANFYHHYHLDRGTFYTKRVIQIIKEAIELLPIYEEQILIEFQTQKEEPDYDKYYQYSIYFYRRMAREYLETMIEHKKYKKALEFIEMPIEKNWIYYRKEKFDTLKMDIQARLKK